MIFGFIFFVGLDIFIHSIASSSTPETAQEKLLQNRRPFEFNGYTLYSGPRHNKFIRFSLENPDGNIIWRQPVSMDHLWVKDEKPMGYITSKNDFYPGRTVFSMILTGPQQQTYLEFLILNKKGQIVRFSQNGPRHKIPEKLPFNIN